MLHSEQMEYCPAHHTLDSHTLDSRLFRENECLHATSVKRGLSELNNASLKSLTPSESSWSSLPSPDWSLCLAGSLLQIARHSLKIIDPDFPVDGPKLRAALAWRQVKASLVHLLASLSALMLTLLVLGFQVFRLQILPGSTSLRDDHISGFASVLKIISRARSPVRVGRSGFFPLVSMSHCCAAADRK